MTPHSAAIIRIQSSIRSYTCCRKTIDMVGYRLGEDPMNTLGEKVEIYEGALEDDITKDDFGNASDDVKCRYDHIC